jgi:membrane protease subunit (stomatin/prohibitin family)
MEDALNKMQHALLEQRYVSTVSVPTSSASPVATGDAKDAQDDATARLDKLKGLVQKGLITQADYDQKKKEILNRF